MKNLEPDCFSRSRYKIPGVVLLLICLAGCISGLYVPTSADAEKQHVSLETLKSGRELYVRNCGSCHNLHLPSSYTKTEWKKNVDKMKSRAKIDNSQVQEINQYLELSAKKE